MLGRFAALALTAIVFPGCGAHVASPGSTASKAEPGPALLAWLASHEPSRLAVSGFSVEAVRRADPDASIRIVSMAPVPACRAAARDHALLIIFAPAGGAARRSAALDCGYALWRDESAVILAPR